MKYLIKCLLFQIFDVILQSNLKTAKTECSVKAVETIKMNI